MVREYDGSLPNILQIYKEIIVQNKQAAALILKLRQISLQTRQTAHLLNTVILDFIRENKFPG